MKKVSNEIKVILYAFVISLVIILVIIPKVTIIFYETTWLALSSIATTLIVLATFLEFFKRRKLEQKTFWGGLSLEMLASGTIKVVNNCSYPIELLQYEQKIIYISSTNWKHDESGNPEISNDEYKKGCAEYKKKLKSIDPKDWKGEIINDGIVTLDPKESISFDESLAYNLSESDSDSDYLATLLLIRVKWEDKYLHTKGIKNYIYRYSIYKPPQGWTRVR